MRFVFLLILLVLPVSVMAADAAPDQSAATASHATSNCGATPAEALKQARVSLAKKDARSEHAALECLIEAVSRLEGESPTAVRDGGNRVLTAPVGPVSVQ